MSRRVLIALITIALAILLVECLSVYRIISHNARGNDNVDLGCIASYAPPLSRGTIVDINKEEYLVYIVFLEEYDIYEPPHQIICFSWKYPNEEYWNLFVQNAEIGDIVSIIHHHFTQEEIRNGPISAISIELEGYEYHFLTNVPTNSTGIYYFFLCFSKSILLYGTLLCFNGAAEISIV